MVRTCQPLYGVTSLFCFMDFVNLCKYNTDSAIEHNGYLSPVFISGYKQGIDPAISEIFLGIQ